jgi:hypothetical protein
VLSSQAAKAGPAKVAAAAAETPASMVRLLISMMSLPRLHFFVGTS